MKNMPLVILGAPSANVRYAAIKFSRGSKSLLASLAVWMITGSFMPKLAAQGPPIISTTSLVFGSQQAGTTSSAQPVTITSHYLSGLSVSSITVAGNFSEIDNCLPASNVIAMGMSCVILVSYSPTSAASDTGQLSITFTGGSAQVGLSGTGIVSDVTLSPSSLTFGSQELYPVAVAPSVTSTAQLVTLTNTSAVSLGISSVTVSGPFTEFDDCTVSSPVTQIAPGLSCIIVANFTPTAAGTQTGQVTIMDSSGNSYLIPLTGLGAGTTGLRLRGASITFGSQTVGTTSVAQVITIINDGITTGYLQITNVSVEGDFAIAGDNCIGATIQTGYSCQILVTFAPTQAGDRAGQITISDIFGADDGTYVPNVVSLFGSGTTPGVSLSSSIVSFGMEKLGSSGPVQSIVLTNNSSSPLTINYIDYTDDYLFTTEYDNCTALPPATSNPIPPGGSCTIQVTDTSYPTGRMEVGKIILDDSDSASPHVIALAGPGSAQVETVTPSFLGAAGSVTLGTGYSGVSLLGTISTIGGFTETNNCSTTSVTCTINVGFPAPSGSVQTGQVSVDEPTVSTSSPIVVALSTAENSAPFASTITNLAAATGPIVFGQPLSLTATVSDWRRWCDICS